jgi:hypothetical protein
MSGERDELIKQWPRWEEMILGLTR